MDRVKPLVIGELAGSAGYSGGERYLSQVCASLDPMRYKPLVIFPEPGPFIDDMRTKGIESFVVPLSPLLNPVALLRLAGILARNHVDLLQTHGARQNFYGVLAARIAGTKTVVWTVHNAIRDYPVSPLKKWCYHTALQLTRAGASRVICVSNAIRSSAIEDLGVSPERTVTVYNGVDTKRFHPSCNGKIVREELGLSDGPVLVTIGRLTAQKGHRYLLPAIPPLRSRWPHLRWLIVGEGELYAALQALAQQLGVRDSLVFLGRRHDIPEILAAADLVVLPSVSEGFPYTVLEALAVGRPVIASSVNGVPELVQNGVNGRLVRPKDPDVLRQATEEMLSDREKARAMGLRGARLVRERFGLEPMIARTVATFEEAMAQARR